jgi:dephospho-CoA kinase
VEALHQRLLKSKSETIVVNGIRMDEFDIIKIWPNASIIYITAPAQERFSRYLSRHEKADDGLMDFSQFNEQDTTPTELAIPELGKKADFRIDNIGTKEELYKKVDEIVSKIN